MSELMELNKFELISRIQAINRDNNQLKTLLIRHQLLTNFYQKLYENCVQLKDFELNKNNKQIKYDLKSKQMKLLSQIKVFTECDKNVSIGLTKLQSEDIAISNLFIEKSTQYEFDTHLTQTESKQIEEFNENMCQSITDFNNDSNLKTQCLIDTNNEVIEHKNNEKLRTNDSQINCISIDLNNESLEESNFTVSDIPLNSVDKNVDKSVTNKTTKLFICGYCHKRYKHKKSFNNHMNQIHSYITNEPKPQNNIKIDETNDKNLDESKISPKSNIIVCQWPECGLKFRNRTLFLRHYSIHNESRKMCSDCGLKFEDSNRLREHMIWHSNQSISISEMTTNQSNSQNYVNGIQTNDKCDSISNDSNTCLKSAPILDKSSDKIDFKLNIKHNSIDRKLCCDFPNCNYKTANSSNLEVHQKRAHEKTYTLL